MLRATGHDRKFRPIVSFTGTFCLAILLCGAASAIPRVGVTLRLKSKVFDVTESLDSGEKSETQLGPIHLSVVAHARDDAAAPAEPRKAAAASTKREPAVQVLAHGSLVKEIPLAALKVGPVEAGPLLVALTHRYEQGMVGANNKIEEGGTKGANPAVEISVRHQGSTEREILFARFPQFTLHNDGVFGHTLRYVSAESPTEPAASPETSDPAAKMPDDQMHAGLARGRGPTGFARAMGSRAPASAPPVAGNAIELHSYPGTPDKLQVRLTKNGGEVLSKWAKKGDSVQTPWMGMVITVTDLSRRP